MGYKIYPYQEKYAKELYAMQSLTSGDVRTVWNKLRFAPSEYKTVEKIIEFLKYELSVKEILNSNYEQDSQADDSNIAPLKADIKSTIPYNVKKQIQLPNQLDLWE